MTVIQITPILFVIKFIKEIHIIIIIIIVMIINYAMLEWKVDITLKVMLN